ncbi:MAG: Ribonuclease [Pedosphaera sp.]|nr:Ribonuclease [Pedosphaera sp.]
MTHIRDFLDEKTVASANRAPLSRLHKFAHFWLLVWKSFSRNRCPVRASALAFTTLLALIPMLFVAISVSSSILKTEGEVRLNRFIDSVVTSMTPPTAPGTNPSAAPTAVSPDAGNPDGSTVGTAAGTNAALAETAAKGSNGAFDRQELVRNINMYIQNIRSTTLGLTGGVILIFMGISLLSRVECTFNDIWGVTQGRNWLARIVQYWAVLTLGPLLLGVALGLASGPYIETTKRLLSTYSFPFVGSLVFQIAPVVILCVTLALFYMLMPNTKVRWDAALVGGLVGGVLWHLNNYLSVYYVSRWVTNSRIYGSLAVIPVFMVGLYFVWWILLFGAQVTYAYQNRVAYLQEKQAENINQRGREFIALRLMQCIGQRFLRGAMPVTVSELSEGLIVPSRLIQEIMEPLIAAHLVLAVVSREAAYAPGRPLDSISCHDILLALRAGQGQELATRDEPGRAEVYGDFERILEAERKAASCVTVLTMATRTEELAALSGLMTKAVADGKHD